MTWRRARGISGRLQQAESAELGPARAANRLRRDGRQLAAAVGLVERGLAHAGGVEAGARIAQRRLVGHFTENKMGVRGLRRNARPARLDQGVAALHRTLGEGQVPARDDVDVGGVGRGRVRRCGRSGLAGRPVTRHPQAGDSQTPALSGEHMPIAHIARVDAGCLRRNPCGARRRDHEKRSAGQ